MTLLSNQESVEVCDVEGFHAKLYSDCMRNQEVLPIRNHNEKPV